MVIDPNRIHVRRDAAGQAGRNEALHCAPAVVSSADSFRFVVDFFPSVLTDVGDRHPSVSSEAPRVEGEFPRVPPAPRPNLVGSRGGGEGIVGWDSVVLVRIERKVVAGDVDAEDLAQKHVSVLSTVSWVVLATPVAAGNVQHSIRAKVQRAPVVVFVGLVKGEDDVGGGRVGHVRSRRRSRVPRDHRMSA